MLQKLKITSLTKTHLLEECEVCATNENLVLILSTDSHICNKCLAEDTQKLECIQCKDDSAPGYISGRVGLKDPKMIHFCEECYELKHEMENDSDKMTLGERNA